MRKQTFEKINNCIAKRKVLLETIRRVRKAKKFILVVKLIWLIKQKTLKAILRLLKCETN